nr:hypothetical protein [Tanacetum cinerariifolium]
MRGDDIVIPCDGVRKVMTASERSRLKRNPRRFSKPTASENLRRPLRWLLEKIHVTLAQLEKKRTRIRLYTKSLEACAYNAWRRHRDSLRRRQKSYDGVRT